MNKPLTREEMFRDIPRFVMSFEVFMKDCLGFKENNDYNFKSMTKTHEELCHFMQFDTSKTKMILMPRGSQKSTITTIGHALWCLVKNPNERILIYSDSASKATNFLNGIKAHIEGTAPNSRFNDYFREWWTDPKTGKWNETEIIIRPRNVSFPEPSIDTGGIETSKVGKHYSRIYFDDIVSDLNVTSKEQMDKVYECYQKAMSLLNPGGDVIITGTRWAFGDPYGRILDTATNLGKFLKSIEKDGIFPFEQTGLDAKFLEDILSRQSRYMVSCLYYNNPISDEDAVFPAENFRFYSSSSVNINDLFITATIDPAGEGEDSTGISVVGTDKEYNLYLLELVNEHLTPNQIVERLIRLSYRWKYKRLGVETNFFRGLLEKEIQFAMQENMKNPNFQPFSIEVLKAGAKSGESKHTRIMALEPYHRRNSIHFLNDNPKPTIENLKGAYYTLAMQMIQYTTNHRPLHDDILDALAWQIPVIRPGQKIMKNSLPQNSLAYIIKLDYDSQMAANKQLPLKYRRYDEPYIL